jgi:hypothetical protein
MADDHASHRNSKWQKVIKAAPITPTIAPCTTGATGAIAPTIPPGSKNTSKPTVIVTTGMLTTRYRSGIGIRLQRHIAIAPIASAETLSRRKEGNMFESSTHPIPTAWRSSYLTAITPDCNLASWLQIRSSKMSKEITLKRSSCFIRPLGAPRAQAAVPSEGMCRANARKFKLPI